MPITLCPACKLPLDITPQMAGQEMACPRCAAQFRAPPPASPPPLPTFQPVADSPGPAVAPRTRPRRPFNDQATSLLDLFDLSFTRYVTPLIVKITWVLALTLGAVWLVVIVLGLIASSLPVAEQSEPTRSTRPSRPQPQFEFRPPEIAERVGDASFAVAFRIVLLITQVIGVILFLLWVRVGLEAVIVVFHMAASLRSIDDKTPRPR
jgi:hypothetical protein